MHVVLIHCYSDHNKGDLGILIATVRLLKSLSSDIRISAISTFEESDPWFQTEHRQLAKYVDDVYPALVGRLQTRRGGKLGLATKALCDLPKITAMMLPRWMPVRRWLWGKRGREVADVIASADLVISKGGSFLCSTPHVTSQCRLWRLLCTLRLSLTLNRSVVIWGQSIGPVYGFGTRQLVNMCLKSTKMTILREAECVTQYPYLKFPKSNTYFGRDLAFSLDLDPTFPDSALQQRRGYVGVTVKRFTDAAMDAIYTSAMIRVIEACVHEHARDVVIIPHVTIDDDHAKSREICEGLTAATAESVTCLAGEFSIEELLGLYGNADLLIGTRLHSTIFAMTVGTPVVNIAYHGTKSYGVFDALGLTELVVRPEELEDDRVIAMVDRILREESIGVEIRRGVSAARSINCEFASLVKDSGNPL